MIIDSHLHIFPDRLAHRTLEKLSQIAGIPCHTDATVTGTLAKMQEWGVSHAVVLHTATRVGQEPSINRFAAQVQAEHPELLCFGAVHPASPDACEIVRGIKAAGMRGVKLHPAYQRCFFSDEAYFPLYQAISDAGLILTLHAGWDPVEPDTDYAPPEGIARVARNFPQLALIAAHLGGMGRSDEAERELCGLPNIWFDTAMCAVFADPAQFVRMVRAHGVERVLFGTDAPWDSLPRELAFLQSTGLSQAETDRILFQNAQCLFGL